MKKSRKSRKKPSKVLAFVLFIVVMLVAIVIPTVVIGGIEQNDKIKRINVAHDLINIAQAVADQSGVEKAKDVIRFVSDNAVVCRTHPEGVEVLQAPKDENYILITPIMPGDIVDERYKNYAGVYVEDTHCLFVESQYSSFFQGLILIHEAFHAYDSVHNKSYQNMDEQRKRVVGEIGAYDLEFEVLKQVGGDDYIGLLQEVTDDISKKAQTGEIYFTENGQYEDQLSKMFGKARTVDERGMRDASLWVNAYFYYIENTSSDDLEVIFNRKIEYLTEMYEKGIMN